MPMQAIVSLCTLVLSVPAVRPLEHRDWSQRLLTHLQQRRHILADRLYLLEVVIELLCRLHSPRQTCTRYTHRPPPRFRVRPDDGLRHWVTGPLPPFDPDLAGPRRLQQVEQFIKCRQSSVNLGDLGCDTDGHAGSLIGQRREMVDRRRGPCLNSVKHGGRESVTRNIQTARSNEQSGIALRVKCNDGG